MVEWLEHGGLCQRARALGVALLDPGERLRAGNIFEPLVRIVSLAAGGREGHVEHQSDYPKQETTSHRRFPRLQGGPRA